MKVLILAGGFGSRLSEETDLKPKPMIEIGGYPILWHIMKTYSAHGFDEFVILLGYKGYLIKEYFSNYYLHHSDITIDLNNNAVQVHESKTEPWQVTLIICGAPGIIFALIYACIKEPKRTASATETDDAMPLSEAVSFMKKNWKVYLAFLGGSPFMIILLYSIQAWSPTLLIRVHEWDISDAGRIYGIVALITGSLGVLSSPIVARLMQNFNIKGYPLLMLMMSTTLTAMVLFIAGQQSDGISCLIFLALASFFVTIPLPQLAVTLQTISPNKMRGMVAGIFVVTGNVMGMGLGPTFVAFFTENIFQDPMSVGLSMGLLGLFSAPIAMIIYINGYKDLIAITAKQN